MNAKIRLKIPYQKQKNAHYCGPAVLEMAFLRLGLVMPQEDIARQIGTSQERGTENENMIRFATEQGFEVTAKRGSSISDIREMLKKDLPLIVNYIEPTDEDGHYAIVSGITPHNIILHDPWHGKDFKLPHQKFLERWKDSEGKYVRWMMVIKK
ncbi:MAG: hypothetical protein HGB08_04420 [Candidatus Moranbacteria bacterium]|nr:hypothetical protein [Candidatus Moranbacteria bacterium]